jgi:hypothetical protein
LSISCIVFHFLYFCPSIAFSSLYHKHCSLKSVSEIIFGKTYQDNLPFLPLVQSSKLGVVQLLAGRICELVIQALNPLFFAILLNLLMLNSLMSDTTLELPICDCSG